MATLLAETRSVLSQGPFDDLRSFLEACQQNEDWRSILDADWNLEIGALTEVAAESITNPPLLLFDKIKGYPEGYRVASLLLASTRRQAMAMGLPTDRPKMELLRLATRKIKAASPIPPVEVESGPVMDNVSTGDDVDLFKLPAPRFHAKDGGRYIGTGDMLINRDPESGFINAGTYRMQVHEPNLLGLWMSPGQHGRLICQRYWDRGEACPVVATFGGDMLSFMSSHVKIPWGQSELDFTGGLLGHPMQVIRGRYTGLPIPASAEVAIEGEVPPPDVEARDEGPFGEWPGYYSGGTRGTGKPQPVIRVKALYHRDNPILVNEAPLWTGAELRGLSLSAGLVWEQLEATGIEDVRGVYIHHVNYIVAVSIKQRYAGHAMQVAHATLGCSAVARNGRYVVIVDEDIDPSNIKEVLWAMATRVDPATDIELVDRAWSTPLDPRMPLEKRENGDHTNSRAIFYAVRPYHWRDKFPEVSRSERALREQVMERYRSLLPFPASI